MQNTVMVVMAVYFGALVVLAIFASRGSSSTHGFYLADRGINGPLTASTFLASLVSAAALVGWTSSALLWGPFFVWAAVAITISIFLSWLYLAPRVMVVTKRIDAITVPDFVAARFDSNTARLLASAVLILFLIPLAVSNYFAAGVLVEVVAGIDYDLAVILFGGFVFLYIAVGGYRAVVWSDGIQALLILAGTIGLFVAAVLALGEPLGEAYAEANPNALVAWPVGIEPGGNFFFAFCLLIFFGALGAPYYLVRFYSVRNGRSLRTGFITLISVVVVLEVIVVAIGLLGRVLFPELVENPDATFITMVQELLPTLMAGIVLGALAAAIMSTIDSLLLVIASTVENDVLHKGLGITIADAGRVWLARGTIAVVGIISIVWALNPPELLVMLFFPAFGVLGLTFAVLFIGGLYWRRFNTAGAVATLIAVPGVFVTWNNVLDNPFGIYHMQATVAIALPIILLVTLLTPKQDEAVLRPFFDRLHVQKVAK